MICVAIELVIPAAVGFATVAGIAAYRVVRLRALRRQNDELRREHASLVRENKERARRILEEWRATWRAS